jgi:phosphotransferase system HPr-like phosphotransfer protein
VRSRAIQLLVVALAVGGVFGVGVGGAAASHGDDVGDREIVQTQTVSEEPEQGVVRVELQYHIGSDVAGMRTRVLTPDHEVVGLDGFSPTSNANAYEWDEQTADPTIQFRVPINEPIGDGYNYVDAGEWAITNRPLRLGISFQAINPDTIEITRQTAVDGEGVAADGMVYLGGYDRYEFRGADEQFALVVSDAASPEWTVKEIRHRLLAASDRFDGGERSEQLTVFVLADPLRRGGLATSTNAAVWIHEAGLQTPQTTLSHEYIHSRQDYERTAPVEWTIEGSASYYGPLLALKDGAIEYHRFQDVLAQGNDYDVVLADPSTWEQTRADYELGAVTIAAIDERLRDNGATYTDLFREKNTADSPITDRSFESLAADFDSSMTSFFDQYIRSTPPEIAVPDPTVYDGPNTGAALDLQVPELDMEPGDTERLTVTVVNTGTEQSLAPQLSVKTSEAVGVSLLDSDGSAVTDTDEGWVFDHLPAGESYELPLAIEAEATDSEQISFAVGDLSNQRNSTSVTLDSSEPFGATLQAPAAATTGETIEVTAATTPEAVAVDELSFTIRGPDGEQTIDSATPTARFFPETAGEYTVSVTATATDGRTATANSPLDVTPAETDSGTTEDSTDDETTDGNTADSDAGDEPTDETAGTNGGTTEPIESNTDDSESSDGTGDGFGPAVAAVAVGVLALLTRRSLVDDRLS